MRGLASIAAGLLALLGACSGPSEAAPLPETRSRDPEARSSPTDADPRTLYRVSMNVDAAERLVRVHATLLGIPRGVSSVALRFERQFAFVTLPPRFAEPMHATAVDRRLPSPEKVDEFTYRIDTGLASAVDLTWSIALDQREQPEVIAGNDSFEHSFVEPGLGMLFTAEILPAPNFEIDQTQVWLGGEFQDAVISPWTTNGIYDFDTPPWEPSVNDLTDGILLLGDEWTTVRTEAAGLMSTFALAPGNEWLLPMIEERLVPIVRAEIELFGWAPRDSFLFAFGPDGNKPGYGGSPKAGAMTLFASRDLPPKFARQGVSHLIAHEFHHLWGRGALRPSDDLRFVSEGYTDYYAYVVPWRLGMISDATMHQTLEARLTAGAEALKTYGRSLTSAGGPEFFAGREAYDACYAAGLTMALWTDLALRQNGQVEGLDETMREWMRPEGPAAGSPAQREVGLAHWRAHLETRLPTQQVKEYMAAIQNPEAIHWAMLFDSVGLVVERVGTSFHISPSCLPRLR